MFCRKVEETDSTPTQKLTVPRRLIVRLPVGAPMIPNVVLKTFRLAGGAAVVSPNDHLGWFRILLNVANNSKRTPSVMRNVFVRDISHWKVFLSRMKIDCPNSPGV